MLLLFFIVVDVIVIMHHHHLFEKFPFFHAELGLDFAPYQFSPHIPENCPLRLQTKQFHVILHTPSPCHPAPAHTFHPATSISLQDDTNHSHYHSQDAQFISICNALPHQPHTEYPEGCRHKSSLRFLSFKDTPHIHLTVIKLCSVFTRLFKFSAFISQVSVPYVKAHWTQAL